jgi:hypothetical protein
VKAVALFACSLPLVLFLSPGAAFAKHQVEIGGEAGVGFTSDLTLENADEKGHVSFDGGPIYGGRFGYRIQDNGFVYLSYHRQEATAYYRPDGSLEAASNVSLAFDHFQFGGNLEATRGAFVPYFGFGLGFLRTSSLSGGGNDIAFSASLDGGLKIEVFPFLHLRLIGRLPVHFVTGDSGAVCVSGAGCGFVYRGDPVISGQALVGIGLQF